MKDSEDDDMDSERPVFVQIVEVLEDGILDGTYGVGDMVASTNQIARLFGVNPETAVKALRTLADRGVVERRRGLGMAVLPEARDAILVRRRQEFFDNLAPRFVAEARKLGIGRDQLTALLTEHVAKEDDHDHL
ncbi:MAG: GntR family transcriptional regulator [Micrococcales bacterium]|nr:GntR family transcriptional regulator [Micrococcales bacterium]